MIPSLETLTRATYWFSAACRVVAVYLVFSWLFRCANLVIIVLQDMLSNDPTPASLVDVLGPGLPSMVARMLAAGLLWFLPDYVGPLIMRWQIPSCPACKRRLPEGVPEECTCGARLHFRIDRPSPLDPAITNHETPSQTASSSGGSR